VVAGKGRAMIGLDYGSTGEWLRHGGPECDVVISSRVRLARNLAGFRFMNQADRAEQQQLVMHAREHATRIRHSAGLLWIDMLEIEPLERSLLVERHLISKQHAKATE